jgi:hypothetical protein
MAVSTCSALQLHALCTAANSFQYVLVLSLANVCQVHVEYQAYVHSQQCASAGKASEMFTYEALWTSNACLTNSLQRRFPCKSCASFIWHQASFPPLLMPCPHTKVHLFAFSLYIFFLYAPEKFCQCHAVFQHCLLIRKRSMPMIATAPQENS